MAETLTGALPVPLSVTFWGLFVALSANVSVPVAAPVAVGLNVTPTEQPAPAPMPVPQVLEAIAKGPVMPMLVKPRDTLWRLVRVIVIGAEVLPVVTVPKFSVPAERVTGELVAPPVPLRVMVCGLVTALSVNVSVPATGPVAVGVKVTPTAQLAPAATLVPHVLLAMLNPELTTAGLRVSATLKRFVRVTVLVELVFPTVTVPKLSELAENVTGAVPVPLRLTVCGLLIALSAKVSVPVAAPAAAGVKLTPTVQLAPAAMPAPQVLLEMAKGPPAGTEMPVNVRAVLRRLVTVTVFAALVLPTASEPKLRLVEERVTGEAPLPDRLTVCVPALSVIVRTPEAEPTVVGENTTATEHEAAGAMLPVQLSVSLKGAATVMLVICSGPLPLLCTVTLRAVLEVPMTCEEKESEAGVMVAAGAVPVPLRMSV